jgi:exosortase
VGDVQTVKGNEAAPAGPAAPRTEWDWNRILTPRIVFLMLPVVLLTLWAYWYPLWRWETIWRGSAAWNHGYLIPLIAILIAHFRLKELNPTRIEPSLWGLPIIMAGLVIRIWSQTLKYGYPGEVTFLIVAAGVVILLLGWPMFKVLWIPVFYLGLMIPWDAKYYDSVALPLQTLSAAATEKFLVLLGMQVDRQVNVLQLASGPLTIAEACSGLHLLFAFVALGIMMAFSYRRALWERLVIIGSSVPIAVFCNFIRVTLMAISSDGLFFERENVASGAATWSNWIPGFIWNMFPGTDLVDKLVKFRENVLNPESYLHQGFGFAMLALAFVLMWGELRLIDMLFVEEEETPARLGRAKR